MKRSLMVLTLASSLYAGSALAFAPTFNLGAGMLIAKEACPDLGINVNDQVVIDAQYTRLVLGKFSDTAPGGFQELLRFTAPDQGAYAFHGEVGLQSTNEFLTHAWDGQEIWHFKGDDRTGDLNIVHGKDGVTYNCHLTNNTGG